MKDRSGTWERRDCAPGEGCLLRQHSFQHFFFNALNSAVSLCSIDPGRAADLLVQISHCLRAVLEDEKELIPLEAELDTVRAYLDIQKVRFGDRLQVEWEVQPVPGCFLPPFLVLQLVDNGLRHGIMKRKAGGRIVVRVLPCGDFIRILVSDDGVGIPEDRQRGLFEAGAPENSVARLRELVRMKLGADLLLQSAPEKGTTVSVEIPGKGRLPQ